MKSALKATASLLMGALLGAPFGWQFMAKDACLDGGGA